MEPDSIDMKKLIKLNSFMMKMIIQICLMLRNEKLLLFANIVNLLTHCMQIDGTRFERDFYE